MPFLKEADSAHISWELNSQRLVYPDVHIVCLNASYLVCDNEMEEILIQLNEEGIDTEDRIIKLKDLNSCNAKALHPNRKFFCLYSKYSRV